MKIIGLLVLLLASQGLADEWALPEPTGFHSPGFAYVAEIFPAKSRQNPGSKPLCYFYQVGYPGTRWEVKAKLLWKGVLVNQRMPYEAVVSPWGHLITLNEHGSVGHDNAVVIYGVGGQLIKRYALEDLIPQEDMNQFPWSTSSRWWNQEAQYLLAPQPARLLLRLKWGKGLEVNLETGAVRYLSHQDLPLPSDLYQPTSIYRLSLRFASITDARR